MIDIKTLSNGFTYLSVENKLASAKIALQGAHLFHYQRRGAAPLLYVSKKSHFENGKAIRGGIPVCWPWFGKHKVDTTLPQHGFARTTPWKCVETKELDDLLSEITLQLEKLPKNVSLWPYKAELQLKITISDTLTIELITTNLDNKPITISSALHSYFSVSSISKVMIKGLNNTPFIDTLTMKEEKETGDISITQETDRVYQEVLQAIELHDADRVINIHNSGSKSVVLWNPWIKKSKKMADMDDNGYKNMLCIETANAFNDERILAAGENHTLSTMISQTTTP